MSVVALKPSSLRAVAKLIASSHERPMDFKSVLPWSQGVDRSMRPKPAEQCWIAGTPYYDQLTEEQRHELLWQETARDVSMFITLEQTLPPLYMGYINKHGDQMSSDAHEYMMLFSKEEIVHTLMFQRYMKLAGLKLFKPADGVFEMLTVQLHQMPPEFGIAFTLVLEWVAELGAMYSSQHDFVEPMTRKMFYEHHVDEARHIAFGRWVIESYLETAPPQAAEQLRAMIRSLMARLVPQFTYNPEIAEHVSFDFPIQPADAGRIAEVRDSPANAALNARRFAPLYSWLGKMGAM